jgi:hypothetical protein
MLRYRAVYGIGYQDNVLVGWEHIRLKRVNTKSMHSHCNLDFANVDVMWGKTYTRKSKPAEGRSVAARDQVDSELVTRNRV